MKRLVICCDGTWNRPEQVREGMPAPTNVAKLALGVARTTPDGTAQEVHYQRGVGTRRFERLRGGAFGLGLSRNVRECYRFLVERYEPGDEIYLFGFSRGAFTARSTAGLVRNAGILRREHAGRVEDAYRLYRKRAEDARPDGVEARLFRRVHSHPDAPVHCIGVWDTVGSLGIPIDGVRVPLLTRRWRFHDVALSRRVRFAFHALAIDELRGPFRPTLWEQHAEAAGQTLEQVWFAGVHCDAGGGYADPALSELPLLWMVDRARSAGLAFDPTHFQPARSPLDAGRRALGELVAPDACGAIHESRKGLYRLLPRHRRALAASGAGAASSAVRRRDERDDYDPDGLRAFLDDRGPVVELP